MIEDQTYHLLHKRCEHIKYGYWKIKVQDRVKTWNSAYALGQSWHIWDSIFLLFGTEASFCYIVLLVEYANEVFTFTLSPLYLYM